MNFNLLVMMRFRLTCLGLLLILVLTACGEQAVTPAPTSGIYRPPTAVVAPTVISLPTSNPAFEVPPGGERPTPIPECTNALWFQEDLTIPDGTEVSPGDKLDKRWLVLNNGSCNWDDRYQVRLIGGPNIGAPQLQALYPARSGSEAVIRMNFIAPQEPGAYRSAWQAYDPDGQAFGDPFFIDFVVVEGIES
jgi:hypothetical protein